MSATRDAVSPFAVPALRRRQKEEDENVADGGVNVAPRTAENDAALARAIESLADKIDRNGQKTWADRWGGTTVTCIVVLISWGFGGAFNVKDTERDLRIQNAVLVERLNRQEQDSAEHKRLAERDAKIADERFRQLEIALQSRGIRILK